MVFFFKDTATTEIYTLSLPDALPILRSKDSAMTARTPSRLVPLAAQSRDEPEPYSLPARTTSGDRKSTRLNSSHANISYAAFCLKKKFTEAVSKCLLLLLLVLCIHAN